MRHLITLAASVAAITLATSSAANATAFLGDYSATVNNADPGLVLATSDLPGAISFSLNNVGETATRNLFVLYTDESSLQSDDLVAKPISVAFSFTLPSAFGGTVTGDTYGQSILRGLFQKGHVTWDGPQVLNFGNGGQLQVSLNDADFNAGLFGLGKSGATIAGTFSLVSAAVPEPATWTMMIAGFGLTGAAIRRRRAMAVAA